MCGGRHTCHSSNGRERQIKPVLGLVSNLSRSNGARRPIRPPRDEIQSCVGAAIGSRALLLLWTSESDPTRPGFVENEASAPALLLVVPSERLGRHRSHYSFPRGKR